MVKNYRPVGEKHKALPICNPTAPSYQDKPFARHYNTHIKCENSKSELKILKRAATTTDRKIQEARMILNNCTAKNKLI